MDDYGVVTAPGTVRLERLLPGPIERVWAYLTESDKRGKWLAAGEMELKAGGRMELKFKHSELSAEPTPEAYRKYEGIEVGRVIRCEPPHLLVLAWSEANGSHSEVTFELSDNGERVRLRLTHRRLASREEMVSVAGGWHAHLGILDDVMNGRGARPFWTMHDRVSAEYQKRIPPG